MSVATAAPAVTTSNARTTPLWRTGALAGIVAAAATTVVAAIALAADVPLEVGGEEIPLAGFAQATLIGAAIGIVLAKALPAGRPAPSARSPPPPWRSPPCRSCPTRSPMPPRRPGWSWPPPTSWPPPSSSPPSPPASPSRPATDRAPAARPTATPLGATRPPAGRSRSPCPA